MLIDVVFGLVTASELTDVPHGTSWKKLLKSVTLASALLVSYRVGMNLRKWNFILSLLRFKVALTFGEILLSKG